MAAPASQKGVGIERQIHGRISEGATSMPVPGGGKRIENVARASLQRLDEGALALRPPAFDRDLVEKAAEASYTFVFSGCDRLDGKHQ
jgi:hypothetical protein